VFSVIISQVKQVNSKPRLSVRGDRVLFYQVSSRQQMMNDGNHVPSRFGSPAAEGAVFVLYNGYSSLERNALQSSDCRVHASLWCEILRCVVCYKEHHALPSGKVALYTQQTYVGVELWLGLWLGLGLVSGLGLRL